MSREDIELRDYLSLLNRKKWFIVGGTLACLVLAAIISLLLPRIYQSSLIIEVGKIYLPPHPEGGRQEVEFIEEPDATGEVVMSEAVLEQVRRELKLDILLKELQEELSVRTFLEDVSPTKMGSPLVEITCENRSPQTAVNILNALAAIIIDDQKQKYLDNRQALEDRSANLRTSVKEMEEVISNQRLKRVDLQKEIDASAVTIRGYEEKISDLDTSTLRPVEVLFLGSYTTSITRNLSMFTDAIVNIDYNIANAMETIADFREQIPILENLVNLSSETAVRSKAILPERYIKPKIGFNIALGGFIGLILTVVISFSGSGRSG